MSPLFWGTKNEFQTWLNSSFLIIRPSSVLCLILNINSEQLELDMDIASFPVSSEQMIKLGIGSLQRDPSWGESKVARSTSPSIFFLCVCVHVCVVLDFNFWFDVRSIW